MLNHLIGNKKIVRFTFWSSHRNPTWPSPVVIRDRWSSRRPVPGPRPRRFVATVPRALGAVGVSGLEVGRGHGGVETRRCHDGVWGETQSLVPWDDFGMFFLGCFFWDVFFGCFFWMFFWGCFSGMFLGATVVFVWGMGENWCSVRFFGGGNRCLWILFFWGGSKFFFLSLRGWMFDDLWDGDGMTIKQCIICGRDSRSWQWQGQNDDSSCWNMF